jgi:zinc and cadmium transporter
MQVALLAVYCLLIVGASLAGGWLPRLMRLTHTRMQFMMSLVGGLMLGVALLHLLPHAMLMIENIDTAMIAALVGLLFMFALIRVFHVHQHGTLEDDGEHVHAHDHGPNCKHDHQHDHGLVTLNPYQPPTAEPHHHHHHHHHGHAHAAGTGYSWMGLAFGLALHTLIDGMALGATVASEGVFHNDAQFHLLGLGTFLAVLLHKPLDAMSITTVMHAGKWPERAIGWINLAFSLMCPLGAALFYFGVDALGQYQELIVGLALAFSGGVFLCISLADILPEVSFHSHDRFALTSALLVGVLLAYGIGYLEPAHNHAHGPGSQGHARGPK